MVFSFRFWWLCNFKHTEGVPMAQLFATEIYTTIWTLPYLSTHREKKILFLELGVGRLTPMFIQEPFWYLTLNLPQTSYISVNNRYNYMPVEIEDRGMVILDDIGRVLADAARLKTAGSLSVASGTNGEDNG